MKPRTRKSRIRMIEDKLGYDFASGMLLFTDHEVKAFFEEIYPKIKNKETYISITPKPSICTKCEEEIIIEFHRHCGCGVDCSSVDDEDEATFSRKAE